MSLFSVVVADPPWAFSDKLSMADVKRGAEAHYNTLTIADLIKLPVEQWVKDDAILALWCPSSLLVEGLDVLKAWGFKHKQVYTWVKVTQSNKIAFGMGRQFRGATEHALIGTRGSPKPASKSERNIDLSLALKHSAKPEKIQERLERMYPDGPFLELFARRGRPGWTCVGNQAPDTIGIDVREWQPQILPYSGELQPHGLSANQQAQLRASLPDPATTGVFQQLEIELNDLEKLDSPKIDQEKNEQEKVDAKANSEASDAEASDSEANDAGAQDAAYEEAESTSPITL